MEIGTVVGGAVRRRPPPWLVPGAVGILLAVLATGIWSQVTRPFLEHDDWEFLLPATDERIDQHHARLLAEGRWFNYAWYRVIGQHLTPRTAALLFALALLLLAVRLAWRWAPGWLSVPTVVALFAWPMLTDLGYWPTTMAPSILLLAGAAWTLPYCTEDRKRLLAWVGLWTFLEFLAYPAMTAVVLVILVVELADRPWRELAVAVGTFVASYAAATGVVLGLNGIVLGTFGVEVRPWRNPNPVHGVGDLVDNIQRAYYGLQHQLSLTTLPSVVAVVAILACLAIPDLRERGYRLVVLVVLGLGLQSAPTVLTGVGVPFRSTGWIWLVPVVALVWLVSCVGAARLLRVSAAVALVVVTGWGLRYERDALDHNQDRRAVYEKVLSRLVTMVRENPGDTIVVVGSAEDFRTPEFTQEVQYLSQKALHDHGFVLRPCVPPGCVPATRPLVVERADRGAHVFRSNQLIVVVPTAHQR